MPGGISRAAGLDSAGNEKVELGGTKDSSIEAAVVESQALDGRSDVYRLGNMLTRDPSKRSDHGRSQDY
jgi:hypothetical protein